MSGNGGQAITAGGRVDDSLPERSGKDNSDSMNTGCYNAFGARHERMAEDDLMGNAQDELRRLLRETRCLPAAREISEDQIGREIADYRSGQEGPRATPPDPIVSDPEVMLGKPVIRGTRITVESILGKLAAGESVEQILEAHPRLTKEGVRAALSFAAKSAKL
jgi:uncharacterized protein (DUF433 family)